MATGQTLLDTMELLNQELQLQSGETDVTRGLVALNRAQDHFEAVISRYPNVRGDQSDNVTASASTETTTFPSGFLRVDGMQGIVNSRPDWPIDPIYDTGGHAWNRYWPYNLISSTTSGKPRAFWTNGTNIYWDPIPDATYTIRVYGFKVASDISAAGTFAYPDVAILPLATFAVKLFKMGVDDPADSWDALADQTFRPVVESMANFIRVTGRPFQYSTPHDT